MPTTLAYNCHDGKGQQGDDCSFEQNFLGTSLGLQTVYQSINLSRDLLLFISSQSCHRSISACISTVSPVVGRRGNGLTLPGTALICVIRLTWPCAQRARPHLFVLTSVFVYSSSLTFTSDFEACIRATRTKDYHSKPRPRI